MTDKTYTATFSDGTTISRTTKRTYTVAWRATWTPRPGVQMSYKGFAASRAMMKPERPNCPNSWHGTSLAGKARQKAEQAAYLERVGYAVEVVPAVLR